MKRFLPRLKSQGKSQGRSQVRSRKEVTSLLETVRGEMTRAAIQAALGLKGRANFEYRYLKPALADSLIELTIPDKPTSSKQKYRLTEKGQMILRNK